MKKNFEQMVTFRLYAGAYLKNLNGEKTKLSYAIEKVDKKLQNYFDEYNEAVNDVRIDNAATDDNGVLLTDEKGNFRFTKEGLKAKNKADKRLSEEWGEKKFNVDAYFTTEIPEDLSEEMQSAFAGFVIEENVLETA